MVNIAILGFGRIGRQAFWQLWEKEDYQITEIYDITDITLVSKIIEYDAPSSTVSISPPGVVYIDGIKILYKQLTKAQCQYLDITDLKADILLDLTLMERDESDVRRLLTKGTKKIIYLDKTGNIKTMTKESEAHEIELAMILDS